MQGHVRKRGKKWCFVVELPRDPKTGKRRQKWVTVEGEKRDAQRAMRAYIAAMESAAKAEKEAKARAEAETKARIENVTLGEYLIGEYRNGEPLETGNWLEHIKTNTKPATFHGYEMIVRRHLIPKLGDIPLKELTPARLEAYYREALQSGRVDGTGGLHPQSIRNHHNVLRKALGRAVIHGLIDKNPAALAEVPLYKSAAKTVAGKAKKSAQMHILSPAQVDHLLQTAKAARIYLAVLIAVMTGMRRGEVLALRWCDADLEGKTISVTRNLQRSKEDGLVIVTPKTKCSIRQIDIPELLVNELKRCLDIERAQCRTLGIDHDEESLILHRIDGSPLEPDNVSGEFSKLLKKAGLPHARFHDLRHTHATTLLKAGVPIKVVSERLGHSSVRVTMDIYQHVLPTMQKEAANKLDQIYRPL